VPVLIPTPFEQVKPSGEGEAPVSGAAGRGFSQTEETAWQPGMIMVRALRDTAGGPRPARPLVRGGRLRPGPGLP
jgi:hypothetical protein